MHAATIRGRLLFLSLSSRCDYYLRAATIWGLLFSMSFMQLPYHPYLPLQSLLASILTIYTSHSLKKFNIFLAFFPQKCIYFLVHFFTSNYIKSLFVTLPEMNAVCSPGDIAGRLLQQIVQYIQVYISLCTKDLNFALLLRLRQQFVCKGGVPPMA